jgi:PAS domain S-box-containing protein
MDDRDEGRAPAAGAQTFLRRLLAYAGAALLALAVHLTRAVLQGRDGADHPTWLFLYFPVLFASARWLGLGPGLVSAGVATVLLAWEAPPSNSLWVDTRGDREFVALFGFCAVLICGLVEFGRRGRSARDRLTRHARAEEDLRQDALEQVQQHEARLEAILNTAVSAILTIDSRGTVQSMNPAAERMFGYAAAEIVGRNVNLLMPAPYREQHDGYLEAYLRTGEKHIIGIGREVEGLRKDGSTFPCQLAVSEVHSLSRRLFTGFITDLSAQKVLEREFLQAQKLEAVGTLANGIAHDFNNLLMGIMACSRMAAAELDPASSVRDLFDEIAAAANRGIALTRRLLNFSRKQAVELHPTSINEVVRENQTMLHQLLGEDVALQIELAPGGAHVLADEGLIEQILINLLINARDAMPKGGEIRVATREPSGDGRVVLEVRDNGCGMTPQVRARIFEPFFSTKGPERGTGLGLSTVQRIVGQLGGSIEVESEVDRGTTFQLTFPRSGPVREAAPPSVTKPAAGGGGKSLLLVEDDRLVRSTLRLFLQRKGYLVQAAERADQALELAAGSSFDVLVTDMVLPDASGSDLAARIRAATPHMKVVFMSAHPEELLREQGRLAPGDPYLQKPFEMEQLQGLLEATVQ